MKILLEEARKANVPPAMLVTHLPHGEDMKYSEVRALVMQRIHAEVDGAGLLMIARAFRRNHRRVRDFLDGIHKKKKKNETSAATGSERNENE